MTEQYVDLLTLKRQPDTITNFSDQCTSLYLLHARLAVALERHERGTEALGKTAGQAWMEAAGYMKQLIETDKDAALKLGIDLVLLPKNHDPDIENIFGWMRSDGPVMLGNDALRKKFVGFLTSDPKGSEVNKRIHDFMNFPIAGKTEKEAFHTPECFLTIASLWLGIRLRENTEVPRIQALVDLALQKCHDPGIAGVVRYYEHEVDTKWIVDDLQSFLA